MTGHWEERALEHCLKAMARLELILSPKPWLRLITAEITEDLRVYHLDSGGDTLTV